MRDYGTKHEPDDDACPVTLNGVKVTKPHFYDFPGAKEGYHRIITYEDYDNLITGTKGARKTVYRIRPNGTCEHLHTGRVYPVRDNTDFVWIGETLFHLPTRARRHVGTSPRNMTYIGYNTFNFDRQENKVLEWTGTSFDITEEHDEDNQETTTDEYAGESLEHPTTEMRKAYDFELLLDKIMRVHPYIDTETEARDFINGEYDGHAPTEDIRGELNEQLEKDELRLLEENNAI